MPALSQPTRPFVIVPACLKTLAGHDTFYVGRKYVEALRLVGLQAWVVPGADAADVPGLLERADGVFLTGSPSNVHPRHFDEAVHDPGLPLDELRDGWVQPLIRQALAHGVPLLGVCRGFQELNVALGGSLHQAVHEQPGLHDHRPPDGAEPDVAYALAHRIAVCPDGLLHGLLGQDSTAVNSLHGQGLKRLAEGLRVEARAPDGLVEAVSAPQAAAFTLAVQWHPEWQAHGNPDSRRIFEAFAHACRQRMNHRTDTP